MGMAGLRPRRPAVAGGTRGSRLVGNTLSNLLPSLWFLALSVVTTPYILKQLGNEGYGILNLVAVLAGWFAFLDVGLGRATIKYISEHAAIKDHASVSKVIGTSLTIYPTIGLVGAALLAGLSGVVSERVLRLSPENVPLARYALVVSAIGFMLNMPLSIFGSIPRALQRFELYNGVNFVIGTLQIAATIIFLKFGYGLRAIAVIQVAASLLGSVLLLRVSRRLLPDVSFAPTFDKATFDRLLTFSGYEAIGRLLGAVAAHANRLFIGIWVAVAAVPYYSVPNGLVYKLFVVTAVVGSAAFPLISELHAQNDRRRLVELYTRANKLTAITIIALAALLAVYATDLLGLWISPEFASRAVWPLRIFLIGAFFSACGATAVVAAQGLGRPDVPARFMAIQSVINVALSLILIPRFGVIGAALAWSGQQIFVVPFAFHHVTHKLLGLRTGTVLRRSVGAPLIAAVICSALVLPLRANGLWPVVLGMCLFVLLYAQITFRWLLDDVDRSTLATYARRFLTSPSK